MGGARPKCTVEWQDALWIAKFPARGDTLNIPRIEYATMTLAGKCGIRIPALHLQSVGKTNVLLVRRFDREKHPEGWVRKGFLSSLSLLQWDEADRLSWDYGAIANVMRRHTSVHDIQELFRRMVFNILVRNTDDHPRNHGFLFDASGVELSPAYDLVPSLTQSWSGNGVFPGHVRWSARPGGVSGKCPERGQAIRIIRGRGRDGCGTTGGNRAGLARPLRSSRLP